MAARLEIRLIWNERQQVRHSNILTRLRQQRGDLPSVVSLMIEKVQDQHRELLVGGNPFGVAVAENERQIIVRQPIYPANNLLVQPNPVVSQRFDFVEKHLVEAEGAG